MKNVKLIIEYDGSRYQGWQRLGKGESSNTISNKLIEVIQKMTNETIELNCGCRTEVGVHAHGQIANFKTNSNMQLFEIKHYLNRYLPQDIAIIDIEEMPERFHASLNAISKIYSYRVAVNESPSVFERKYVFHSFKTPDVSQMKEAALLLQGEHDFKLFSTVKRNKSTVKRIESIDIYSTGDELQITIEANDFLHNMPRILIELLLDIGLGKRPINDINLLLNGMHPKEPVIPCDSKGLYLQDIIY